MATKEIPNDVAFTILSKLPPKSLKRFTCVHKSWAALLETPYFINTFGTNFVSKHHSYYDDTSLILHHASNLYLLSGDKFDNRAKLYWPLGESIRFIRILGCIHGIFCLLVRGQNIVLWNPNIKEFRFTPPSLLMSFLRANVFLVPHGFGYDPVRDDFKVIRHIAYFPILRDDLPHSLFWEIYSLRSHSWRKLAVDMPIWGWAHGPNQSCDNIYMNGVCHWLGSGPPHYYGSKTHLGSFNFTTEAFSITPLPLDLGHTEQCLVVLNGSIALISKHAETTTFHISSLGELGIKESWTKLFIVGPLPGIGFPIGAGNKGDIFFRKENGKLALFDLSTQMLKEIIAEEILDKDKDQIIIYKEGIIRIGGEFY